MKQHPVLYSLIVSFFPEDNMGGSVPGQDLTCTFTGIMVCAQRHGNTCLSIADKPHTVSNTVNVVQSPNSCWYFQFSRVCAN